MEGYYSFGTLHPTGKHSRGAQGADVAPGHFDFAFLPCSSLLDFSYQQCRKYA
jgi:hypothetical protein